MLWNEPSVAASLDCALAKTAREKLICADPELSDIDGKLGRIYQERRAALSPQGAALLQRSEQSWLHFVAQICPIDRPVKESWQDTPKLCFQKQYKERLTQLGKVAQHIGPFVFNRVDLYGAKPASDDSGSAFGFDIQHTAYPQIDNAGSPVAAAWNHRAVKGLQAAEDCGEGDEDIDFEIGYASANLISVQQTDAVYCHGTPHGFFSTQVVNTVLQPTPHALAAADLFGSGAGWMARLQKMFWQALLAKGWSPPENIAETVKTEIAEKVIRPESWLFTADGLQVSFSAYEGGCYACNPGPVTVSWTVLKPLLASTDIAP